MRTEPIQRIPGRAVHIRTMDRTGPSRSKLDRADLATYMKALRCRARRLTGNHADADDLAQETLKRVLIYKRDRADIANLRAFLFTVLKHAYYDSQSWRPAQEALPLEDTVLVSPPAQIDRLECHEMMVALDDLPKGQRQVLLLVGLEGHSYKDTAASLEIPIGTVMSRLSRGRARLSHKMG